MERGRTWGPLPGAPLRVAFGFRLLPALTLGGVAAFPLTWGAGVGCAEADCCLSTGA